jgi:hypothetical protein
MILELVIFSLLAGTPQKSVLDRHDLRDACRIEAATVTDALRMHGYDGTAVAACLPARPELIPICTGIRGRT